MPNGVRAMTSSLTNAQVDRLGERLKADDSTEADLQLLDQHRRSFAKPYEDVIHLIREQLRLDPTGRPAKSTTSIVEKLRRESIRLSQMQDIAGCRLVVGDMREQEHVAERVRESFGGVTIVDRRRVPSHGYRAIHAIIRHGGKPIEMQVRTRLQHMWSELSEKLADIFDPAVKYGGGPDVIRDLLAGSSRLVAEREAAHLELLELVALADSRSKLPADFPQEIARLRALSDSLNERTVRYFRNLIADIAAQQEM
jgi:ppGpp synthetase/RelA/SpoT-type nucleotidyltranferase